MNTVYRSIWNEALHSWVAVPEWATACGKASRSGVRKSLKRGFGALSMGFVLSAVSQAVLAACPADSVNGVAVSTGETCSAGLPSYVGGLSASNGGSVLNVTSGAVLQGSGATPINLAPLFGLAAVAPPDVMPVSKPGASGTSVFATNTGTVNLNGDTSIFIDGVGAKGLSVSRGGVINSTGKLSIYSVNTGDAFSGPVVAGTNVYDDVNQGVINLKDVSIYMLGNRTSSGLSARGGGLINVTGDTYIRVSGADYITPIDAQFGGVVQLGQNTTVDFAGNALGGGGIAAEASASKQSTVRFGKGITNGKVTVRTEGSPGIAAYQGGMVDFSGGTLDVKVGVPIINNGTTQPLQGANHPTGVGIIAFGKNIAQTLLSTVKYGDATVLSSLYHAVMAEGGGIVQSTGTTSAMTTKAGTHAIYSVGGGSKISMGNANGLAQGAGGFAALANQGDITVAGNLTTDVTGLGTVPGAPSANGVQAIAGGSVAVGGTIKVNAQQLGVQATGSGVAGSSHITAGAANIETQNASGYGIQATQGGYVAVAGDTAITTHGLGSHAITVDSVTTNAANSGNGVSVGGALTTNTTGDNVYGVNAVGSGVTVQLNTAMMQSTGTGNGGLYTSNAAQIQTSGDASVAASGAGTDSGFGVSAQNLGTISIGGNLSTKDMATGASATMGGAITVAGKVQMDSSTGKGVSVSGDNSTFSAAQAASGGHIVVGGPAVDMSAGQSMKVSLSGLDSMTTTGAGPVIRADQTSGSSEIKLSYVNAQANTAGSNTLLDVSNSPSLAFLASGSQLKGNVIADASSPVHMELANGSSLTGSINAPKADLNLLTIAAPSPLLAPAPPIMGNVWHVTGNSVLGQLNNAGTVAFDGASSGLAASDYHTVTVDKYVGSDGKMQVRTYLAGSGSLSDKLVLNSGGTATGTTTVQVTNTGGLGAPTSTTGDTKGIQVVQALGSATTDAAAFNLHGGTVIAGAYEYSLKRNTDESWYLTSAATPTPPSPPPPPAPPPPPPPPPDVISPTVSLYSAAPSLAILQNAAVVDTLHQRMGGAAYGPLTGDRADKGRLWARVIGDGGNIRPEGRGIAGGNGAAFDYRTYALQLGVDVLREDDGQGQRTAAGLYLAQAYSSGDVTHYDGRNAGKNSLNSTSLGAYWTRFFPEGSYLDVVGQYSYSTLKSSYQNPSVNPLKTHGDSVTLSVEGGHAFELSPGVKLEPQVQLRAQHGSFDNANDGASLVRFGDFNSLSARAGLRLSRNIDTTNVWGRFDVIHEFEGRTNTTLSTLGGAYPLTAVSSLRGTSVALTGGVESKLTPSTSVYASGRYEKRLTGSGHSVGVAAGVKWIW